MKYPHYKPDKTNLLLFFSNNIYYSSPVEDEMIEMNHCFFDLYSNQYNLFFLNIVPSPRVAKALNQPLDKIVTFRKALEEKFPAINVIDISIDKYLDCVYKEKTFEIDFNLRLDIEFDVIYTSLNERFLDSRKHKNIKELSFKEIRRLTAITQPHLSDLILCQHATFRLMQKTFENYNALKYQFIFDPLETTYNDFTILHPDIKNENILKKVGAVYFPLFQYYRFVECEPCKQSTPKPFDFAVGLTINDLYRTYLFDRYLLNLYERQKDNEKYKFFINGYQNYKFKLRNFIPHKEFYNVVGQARFGFIMNTYSGTVNSSNKFAVYLSRNVVPFLSFDCDDFSQYYPQHVKDALSVKDGIDLIDKLRTSKYEEMNEFLQNEFQEYREFDYYKSIFDKYFLKRN